MEAQDKKSFTTQEKVSFHVYLIWNSADEKYPTSEEAG